MAIYRPTPTLSDVDKKLLRLMAKLLVENLKPQESGSNRDVNSVMLTDGEAREIIELLNRIVESEEFQLRSFFVEGMTLPGAEESRVLREIFLSERKRRGRTRTLASVRWGEFQFRLGIIKDPIKGGRARPMGQEHFIAMERQLLGAAGLHPYVIELLLEIVRSHWNDIEDTRAGQKSLVHGSLKKIVVEPFQCWHEEPGYHASTSQIAAAITIIADSTVLFTTRDWGVAGTLSTMAAAFAALKPN